MNYSLPPVTRIRATFHMQLAALIDKKSGNRVRDRSAKRFDVGSRCMLV